jgi:GntR family transcriptional regulator, transcriptional repressor for pyruvate dehydrogenase complex
MTRDQLLSTLTEEVVSGRLAAGARLPSERQLTERSGLSRPVIREVLRGLEERGLVQIEPGRGTFVRELSAFNGARPMSVAYRRSLATPSDLVAARLVLEQAAAEGAATHATDEDIAALRQALESFDAADDVVTKARYDIAFHALVARAAHNPVLEIMFASIAVLVFELMLRSLSDPTVSRAGIPFHGEIVDAIAARDGKRAKQAMTGHLEVARKLYGRDLDRSLDQLARRELERSPDPWTSLEPILEDTLRTTLGPGSRSAQLLDSR